MIPASVIDVFCGVGGMSHGFVREGFNVVAGIDIDESCRYPYEINNNARFVNADINEASPETINNLFVPGQRKVLIGCAPCQPFSKYSNTRTTEDNKWSLVASFGRLITAVQPHIVSMENVPELAKHWVFDEFINGLTQLKYHVSYKVVDCVDYGVPQTRKRLVLLASLLGEISLVPKTHPPSRRRSVSDTIQNLEPLTAGGISQNDPLHRSSNLTQLNLQRIMITPEGGSWIDWPEELRLECHKRETGKSYPSVYGRMKWNEPSPTLTTQFHGLGNGRFGHPEQHRAISLREGALLQTFPSSYQFVAPEEEITTSKIAKHIGNAVPVRLGQIVARSIRKHLDRHHG